MPKLVYATEERRRKLGGIRAYQTQDAGVFADLGYENILDFMLDQGMLGQGETGERRHSTAVQIRDLFLKTHKIRLVGSYGEIIKGESELSDSEAWNYKAFLDIARNWPREWKVVAPVCCDSEAPKSRQKFNEALDSLQGWAEIRAGYILNKRLG